MGREELCAEMRRTMGFFQKYFVNVRRGTKITYSESDLRKLDREYEKKVIAEDSRKIRSAIRKVPQQVYLTQTRDYAFERILDRHTYTFQHILVIPNPYDLVKQSALLLFNSSKETKIRYRVIGDTPEADFTAETEYTTRHRVPVLGLYLERNNRVELEMLDTNGDVVKRRMLRLYVSDTPQRLKKIEIQQQDKELSHFPFIMLNGASYSPFAIDRNGAIRYSIQLWTKNVGMLPLANGHFLYEDRTANRMNGIGQIKACRFHEMDYLGRIYRTFLINYSVISVEAQCGELLYLRVSCGEDEKERKLIELNLTNGEVTEMQKLPDEAVEACAKGAAFIDVAGRLNKNFREGSDNMVHARDEERTLSCTNIVQEGNEGRCAELTETDAEGRIVSRRVVSKAANKVWLFEPDISDFCKMVAPSANVVFGALDSPEVFTGELPAESDEPINRAYYGNVRLCDSLFIGYILPGRVSRVYLIGKEHRYVQDYTGMHIIGKRRFPMAISLEGLAKDEYSILIESRDVVHRLKNSIRVVED